MNAREIFANALRLATPAERAAYLDEACAGNPQLRAEVEALLRAHTNEQGLVERTADTPGETVDMPSSSVVEESPTRDHTAPTAVTIGHYKLIEQIGEGGMGTVWMAQQTEPVKRLVALKLIKAGMDSRQIIARFEAERQALALMDHPNIARVLDAGTTTDGRPYFVMDLVKGVPITRYCDEHHLTPRQRLELFVPVCQAIQHAHQKGVIHRDLKPSNVLVALYDGRPVPKVIDFGVAKATGQALTDRTLVTGSGAVVGTLEYMSPEQAEVDQLDIDTRSDVYSLGVLLYELLTGSPPFSRKELENAGMLEMLRVIREKEPSRPSTKLSTAEGLPTLAANRGTEPAKLTKLVRGELDWIVMKCLEKSRDRRYESANGLAMDLLRYLADERVQACPPSAGYRLRKFIRRHKGPVLAASLVLLTLVGGIIATTLALLQARDAAARADEARESEGDARRRAEAAHRGEKQARAQADSARVEAERKSGESRDRLVRHYVASGARLVEEGDLLAALPWLAEALKEERGDPAREEMHRVRLAGVLDRSPRLKQIWFHDRFMTAHHAEFSPDGRQVLIAVGMPTFISGHRGAARVWDADTGKPVTPPLRDGLGHPVWHAEFSPDGQHIVTASGGYVPAGERTVRGSGELRVRNARTGETVWSVANLPHEVRFAGFSADGRFVLAAYGNSGISQVWDARTGQEVSKPVTHTRSHSLAFSPDGKSIAVGSWMQARIVDAVTGEELTPALPHAFKQLRGGGGGKAAVAHTAFSGDGTRVVTASTDETARVWDSATGKPLSPPLRHYDSVNHASFSPDGRLVVTASDDGMARVWNAETGELQAPPILHTGHVTHAWFSPDGKSIVTVSGSPPPRASDDNCYHVVRVWDAATGNPLTPPLRHGARVTRASFSPDGTRLLTASADRTVRLWELAPTAERVYPFVNAPASHGAISPDCSLVVNKSFGKGGRIWNLSTGTSVPLSNLLSGYVQYLAFSPNGRYVVVANGFSPWGPFPGLGDEKVRYPDEKQARIYDALTGRAVGPPLRHEGGVLFASFSPDGQRVVTASADKAARVWEVVTGNPLTPPLRHDGDVTHASFSPDGQRVVTAAWDSTVRVWDATSGEQLGPSIRAGRSPCHASFSPDGRQVFVTGYDRTAGVWDAATGEAVSPVSNHGGHLLRVTFLEGECRILVASDEVARVWNVSRGGPVTALLKHGGRINSGTFSRDGRRVVTAGDDGTVRVWDAASGDPVTPALVYGPARRNGNRGAYGRSDFPQAAFTPEGDRLVVAGWAGIQVWNLQPASRAVDELVLQAQVTSGAWIDGTGAHVPLDTDALRTAWERLRK